jgi:hypothetical protein
MEPFARLGLPEFDQAATRTRRYALTDLATALDGGCETHIRMAARAALYSALGDFALRAANQWGASGESLPRLLRAMDADLALRFEAAAVCHRQCRSRAGAGRCRSSALRWAQRLVGELPCRLESGDRPGHHGDAFGDHDRQSRHARRPVDLAAEIGEADSVNPLAVTRDEWRRVAASTSSPIVEIEVVCSDPTEHRRRVETRATDVPGLALPSWQDVVERDYEPWDRSRIVLDTAGCTILDALKELRRRISNTRPGA